MKFSATIILGVCALASAATTLQDVCTVDYVQASLPVDVYTGITIDPESVAITPVTNYNASGENMYPDAIFDFCNVTFSYAHDGRDDKVNVNYWLPAPADFQNRYLSTGGGAYAIYSGSSALAGGIPYGAVAGGSDGGFGSFTTNFDTVLLLANGTVNWEAVFMFGYQAHHELSVIGKAFTKQFFNMSADDKLYSYYQGCSEGGREGWSQVQRYGDEFDGAAIGAPAFRYAFQQINHLTSNVVEQTLDYYPPPCEMEMIVNATIAACDPLDGKTDGVVSRTDLCKLNFDLDTLVGTPYYCAASTGGGGFPGKVKRQMGMGGSATTTPAQNGTISAQAVAVAKTIIKGLQDTNGDQVYLSYQPSSDFSDAQTTYNSTSGAWELSISGVGGEFIQRFLNLVNSTSLDTLDGVTYDTLRDWMVQAYHTYADTLHTAWPDLTPFNTAGGKIIHYHGESDYSVPTASSVRYWESVRDIMYPDMSVNQSTSELNEWYRLFLVPGAGHCGPNTEQPNGPFPQTNLAVLIDWVENDVEPTTLNATVLQGENKGENQQLCAWPLRPYWTDNGTVMECQYDQASINSWIYTLDGVKMPVY